MEISNPKILARALCASIKEADVDAVRELLANGCPVEHPGIETQPLLLALESGNTDMIDALVDAGATLPKDPDDKAFDLAIKLDNARLIDRALARGDIAQEDVDHMLFDAATRGATSVGMKLLDWGASPLYRTKSQTVFARAVSRGRTELAAAMLDALRQDQKDTLLAGSVQDGSAPCVEALLGAGANPAQHVEGRTLLQIAPRDAEKVRRLLRSALTGASIKEAMGGDDAPEDVPAPSAKSSFTL